MTSASLNHELLALPVLPKKRGIPPLRTFSPLGGTLPCDVHLLNLRSIQGQVTAPCTQSCAMITSLCY